MARCAQMGIEGSTCPVPTPLTVASNPVRRRGVGAIAIGWGSAPEAGAIGIPLSISSRPRPGAASTVAEAAGAFAAREGRRVAVVGSRSDLNVVGACVTRVGAEPDGM